MEKQNRLMTEFRTGNCAEVEELGSWAYLGRIEGNGPWRAQGWQERSDTPARNPGQTQDQGRELRTHSDQHRGRIRVRLKENKLLLEKGRGREKKKETGVKRKTRNTSITYYFIKALSEQTVHSICG